MKRSFPVSLFAVLLFVAPCVLSQDAPQFDGKPVYKLGSGVTPPRATYTPIPEYSDKARRSRIQGTVQLKVIVAPDGKAHDITVTQGLGYGLDEQAVKSVKKWRFDPALRNGEPVPVEVPIEVSFRLR